MQIPNKKIYNDFDDTITKAFHDVSDFCEKINLKEVNMKLLQCILAKKICFASLLRYKNGRISSEEARDEIKEVIDMVFEYCLKYIESQKNENE